MTSCCERSFGFCTLTAGNDVGIIAGAVDAAVTAEGKSGEDDDKDDRTFGTDVGIVGGVFEA